MSTNITNYPNYNYQNQAVQQPSFTADGKPIIPNNGNVVPGNPLINAATSSSENPALLLLGTGLGAAALMPLNNVINNPLLTKEYDTTFYKKVETFIDSHTNNKFFKNINNALRKANYFYKKKIVNNFKPLKALYTKRSIGGSMVQSQAAGAKGHLASRAVEIMENYKKQHTNFHGFDNILSKVGKGKQAHKYYDEIIDTIKNSGANLTEVLTKKPKWGLGLIKNKGSLKEILNKDLLIRNYKAGHKTLGQKAAGFLLRGAECLTNGVFSGKGAVLLQAFFIAQSLSEASKAEKGEKFSSFMASWMELMAFMATAGIQMRVVNSAAGLKFLGMNSKRYQKAVKIANRAAKLGDQRTYNKMVTYIKNMKKAAKSNIKWYEKPFQWLGKVVGFGRINETIKPLKNNKIGNILAKIPYGLKVGAGYVGRLALIMGVVIPLFSGIAKKVSHTIFGKPTKTIEKEKEAEKAAEKVNQEAEQKQMEELLKQTQQNQTPTINPQQPRQAGDLLTKMEEKYKNPTPVASQPMQPAATSIKKTAEEEAGVRRSYVPNPVLGVENIVTPAATRSSEIDALFKQADWAEAQAQKYL